MVVLEYSKSNKCKCYSCNKIILKDILKYGTTINNDGYINIQWHHEDCFWNKRVIKYYKRGKKKINIILTYEQFSNDNILNENQQNELKEKILESNLKYATEKALEKAGIIRNRLVDQSIITPSSSSSRKRNRTNIEDEEEEKEEENNKEQEDDKQPQKSNERDDTATLTSTTITQKKRGRPHKA